ncbi:Aminomethyltransferase [Ectocarpus siliculosus]|uniref:Aminomethyltransferase n=1 Tax=Ectocarpus siliculosus TaxID=2880 RepID=D7G1U3_ECTSI|nr:Aminomethyltransferase [Ectocarpus siliculosus]|eukprot:CBJ48669.1 Aminomethyltransferase [Ectocarpus siliculosus]
MIQATSTTLRRCAARACNGGSGSQALKQHAQRATFASGPLEKTAYHQMHVDMKGKMVPFAGYELPVLYEGEGGGVMNETLHCRAPGKASVFDVSHMGQIRWTGKDAADFIERCVVGDIKGLKAGEGRLTLITNANGGIVDDTVVTNAGDYIYMVVNGACKHGDMAHFKEQMADFKGDVHMDYMETQQLLALQGKGAPAALQSLMPDGVDVTKMLFMTGVDTTVAGIEGCRVTRCGYTGEDGYEVSVPYDSAVALAESFLGISGVEVAGLGARDALRLEAGLCLYGNDIDATTNPVEGSLAWTMGGPKGRRRLEQGFLGAEHFLTPEGKLKKQSRKRVGIFGMRAPARDGTEIFDAEGKTKIGTITSGTFSPCLKKPVAMGYVETAHAKNGTDVMLKIRNKMVPTAVTAMPFLETSYYKP